MLIERANDDQRGKVCTRGISTHQNMPIRFCQVEGICLVASFSLVGCLGRNRQKATSPTIALETKNHDADAQMIRQSSRRSSTTSPFCLRSPRCTHSAHGENGKPTTWRSSTSYPGNGEGVSRGTRVGLKKRHKHATTATRHPTRFQRLAIIAYPVEENPDNLPEATDDIATDQSDMRLPG